MSLLWIEAARRPAVQHVPTSEIMKSYRPTEGSSWDNVRKEFHEDHPVMMDSLREDIGEKGIEIPVDAFRDHDGAWAIHNGHHRILTAHENGVETVPVKHWKSRNDIPKTKQYWHPDTRHYYGQDEDYDDEGQLRY